VRPVDAAVGSAAVLWVDWDRHLRTRSLCQRLGIELLEVKIGGTRLVRYLKSAARTLRVIRSRRPAVVIATNPSLMLGLLLLLLRRWYRFALVADAHHAGVQALSGSRALQMLLDFYNAHVALVIVTTEGHAQRLRAAGCNVFVCPDPLPFLTASTAEAAAAATSDQAVFLVCSFDPDEPYAEAFAAFGALAARGYSLLVSGNYRKVQLDLGAFPGVHFLGFMPDEQYYATLQACAVVMDLTLLEDCLVCGAYEALAAKKPLITSGSAALRSYFGDAAVFTGHEPQQIAASVERAFAQREELVRAGSAWSARNERYLAERLAALSHELRALGQATIPARQPS
jgi:glycosyltransferase involved in cell wall biosynthesis